MASGLTPIYSIPYPLLTDNVNVHGDMEDLASQVEDVLAVKANLNINNLFTGTSSFLVNTATPAIAITQTGSGAALLVKNSLSGSEPAALVVDQSAQVGIGISSPTAKLHVVGGSVIFDATVVARSAVTVGVDGAAPVLFQVYGAINSDLKITAPILESSAEINFFDPTSERFAKILSPTSFGLDGRNYQLPSVSGTFITTGNLADAYPSQTGNSGRVLTTNGTTVSWAPAPNQVPSITGQAGKYLSTDGSTYFWQSVLLIPALDPTPDLGTAGKWLTNNGSQVIWDFLPGDEPFIEVTEDIVLTVGANLFVDTRGGNIEITMPPDPLPGATVSVFDTQDFFQSNYVIIKPGAEKINGIVGDLILDVGGATVVFIYINETIGWRVA